MKKCTTMLVCAIHIVYLLYLMNYSIFRHFGYIF